MNGTLHVSAHPQRNFVYSNDSIRAFLLVLKLLSKCLLFDTNSMLGEHCFTQHSRICLLAHERRCGVKSQACSWTGTCFLWDKSCGNKCGVSTNHIASNSLERAVADKTFYHVFACPGIALMVKELATELAELEAAAPADVDTATDAPPSPNMMTSFKKVPIHYARLSFPWVSKT